MRGEFDLIRQYFAPLAAASPGALSLEDDGALITPEPGFDLVLTKDALVEGVHFRTCDPPDLVGRKLLRVNLSDLAAMGAEPVGYLVAAMLPPATEEGWIAGFARGLAADQELFGIRLLGGDTTATKGPVALTLTAIGRAPAGAALRRNGARAGDRIYVSGTFGDAALGLGILRGDDVRGLDEADRRALEDRYLLPEPRLALGSRLRGLATSAIDVSDGLVQDLGHICECSDVGAEITAAAVPVSRAASRALASGFATLEDCLAGGDDYELLFTVAPDDGGHVAALGRETGVPVTEIGRIVEGRAVTVRNEEGRAVPLHRSGYQHFT